MYSLLSTIIDLDYAASASEVNVTIGFNQRKVGSKHLLTNPNFFPEALPEYFSSDYWQSKKSIIGHAGGRGEVIFFQHNGEEWALKQYRRGGLFGKVIKQSYLSFGIEQSRAYREFELLFQMRSAGLPCPEPGCALIESTGPITRASLITRRISDARELVTILQEREVTASEWEAIGRTIAQFHRANIYHSDLNAHNILLTNSNQVFLIDFDKCEQRNGATKDWQQSNLDRLQRSLLKESRIHSGFHWSPAHWESLLAGYNGISD